MAGVSLANCNQKRILVVEDEPAIRLMIADALRTSGFEVVETGSGDEALAVVENGTTVHLAFVDVRLPGTMDGIALVSRLRETHPDIKLAVVSAYPPDWPSPRLVEVFIGKPYDVSRTVTRLRALLEGPAGPAH